MPMLLMLMLFLQNWRKNILVRYKVKFNPRAFRELDSIYEYIANEKLAPENARVQIDNYIAIFRIDESTKTVYVVTLQYQGRCI